MKTLRTALFAFLLTAAASSSSGVARAAPRSPAPAKTDKPEKESDRTTTAMTDAAALRFNEAVKLYAKKKYDKALAAFVQAYALTGNPAVLVNLGLTALKLSDPLRAARFFSQYLKDAPDASADGKRRAQNGLAEARKSLGSVEIVAPEGAAITVDGEGVGRAPLAAPIDVLPGHHTIASTTASGSKSEQVDAPAGATTKVKLGTPGPPTPPPNAALEPEERPSGESPSPSPPSPPEAPGLFSPPDTLAPVYVAGFVGIGMLTAAIVLRGIGGNAERNISVANDALARNGKDASACTDTPDPTLAATCSSLGSAQRADAAVGPPFIATLSIGVAATLFALGWYFFASKAEPEAASPGPHVTPEVGPHGAGTSFELRF